MSYSYWWTSLDIIQLGGLVWVVVNLIILLIKSIICYMIDLNGLSCVEPDKWKLSFVLVRDIISQSSREMWDLRLPALAIYYRYCRRLSEVFVKTLQVQLGFWVLYNLRAYDRFLINQLNTLLRFDILVWLTRLLLNVYLNEMLWEIHSYCWIAIKQIYVVFHILQYHCTYR